MPLGANGPGDSDSQFHHHLEIPMSKKKPSAAATAETVIIAAQPPAAAAAPADAPGAPPETAAAEEAPVTADERIRLLVANETQAMINGKNALVIDALRALVRRLAMHPGLKVHEDDLGI